jgi:solute carrier family 13 (sodium-dependent dicarboxylate transporter), member 2/3/5
MVKHRIIVFAPLVMLPLLLLGPEQPSVGRMAWIVGVMAIFWATEALPVAVSSMLPLVLLPALGIMPAERVANNYWKDMCVLFFGGLIVAAALEAVGLHRRIALRVLLTCGSKPVQLLLGFMSATAFLSMWMSNTATTAMMMPIVEAVLQQLEAAAAAGESEAAAAAAGESEAAAAAAGEAAAAREAAAAGTTGVVAGAVEGTVAGGAAGPPRAALGHVGKALVLGVAYAANIGGMATLTGTGPNLILAGDLAALYPAAPGLSFAAWLAFAFPRAQMRHPPYGPCSFPSTRACLPACHARHSTPPPICPAAQPLAPPSSGPAPPRALLGAALPRAPAPRGGALRPEARRRRHSDAV